MRVVAFFSGGESATILLALFALIVAAKLLAELFERLRQPAVIGEILAGILIGPSLLNFIHTTDAAGAATTTGIVIDSLANIGVIFLLFTVGLETRPSELFKVGKLATSVALLGAALPFLTGWLLILYWPGGHSHIEAIFTGAAMVATSVGITARVLSGLGLISTEASRVILAAAVIDDVIGLLVLAVVSSLASGHVNYLQISITAILAVGFTIFVVLVGAKAVNKIKAPVEALRINHSLFIFSIILCFGLAAVANFIGIAGIVGAFLAGVALSEASDDTDLHQQAQALTEFTTPFFLVNIGLKLNLAVFLSPQILLLSVVVTVLAIITKLIGCGLPALTLGRRRALQIGVGMAPRGEVGIVVAQIGLGLAAVSDAMYAVVLFMAVATTLAAPPLIKIAFANESAVDRQADGRELHYEIH
ncbi:MAG: cation:proton antiporter [Acidobacteria bacterium]|nr:cation:proton antiporter [Acidobacteriota bacterium]